VSLLLPRQWQTGLAILQSERPKEAASSKAPGPFSTSEEHRVVESNSYRRYCIAYELRSCNFLIDSAGTWGISNLLLTTTFAEFQFWSGIVPIGPCYFGMVRFWTIDLDSLFPRLGIVIGKIVFVCNGLSIESGGD
jgi:hypothetical protein